MASAVAVGRPERDEPRLGNSVGLL